MTADICEHIYQLVMRTPFKVAKPVIEELCASSRLTTYRKGDLIIIAGQDSYAPSILLEGLIRVFYLDPEGSDVTNLFIFEDSFYGSDFLTMKKSSVCSFEALEDCRSLLLDREVLAKLLKQHHDLLLLYVAILERSLNRKIMRENALISQSASERYLQIKQDYPNIEQRVSQSFIASYLGITPVSLSRIRRLLREEKEAPR